LFNSLIVSGQRAFVSVSAFI